MEFHRLCLVDGVSSFVQGRVFMVYTVHQCIDGVKISAGHGYSHCSYKLMFSLFIPNTNC